MFRITPRRPRLGASLQLRKLTLGAVVLVALAAASQAVGVPDPSSLVGPGLENADWNTIGHDPGDSRSQPNEHTITTRTSARSLRSGSRRRPATSPARRSSSGGAVYFGDFGVQPAPRTASLQARRGAGASIWSHPVSGLHGPSPATSRARARRSTGTCSSSARTRAA